MLRLIEIREDGSAGEPVFALPREAEDVLATMEEMYRQSGYRPPWLAYLALEPSPEGTGVDRCVGTCAFKSEPRRGRVEIAYYTFPPHEGRGVASAMARALIALSRAHDPRVTIAAQTLPEASASTTILGKLGFQHVADVQHREDGLVWEWQLRAEV
jgi:ribosomal-protein-alanine N-acetyltransferase